MAGLKMGASPACAIGRSFCVVYLAWGPLGVEPVRRFVASYRRHPAGVDHRLVVLLNGVGDGAAREAISAELQGIEHASLAIDDPVLDLVAYRRAADTLTAARYLFLNSYARILAPGWLEHLGRALDDPANGIAAASGSWASMLSYALFQLGLPSTYRRVFGDRRATLREFERLHEERTGQVAHANSLRRQAGTLLSLAPMLVGFRSFPAYHVRTNAFAVDHETLTATFPQIASRKVQTHRLESGRRSITAEIERSGRRAVVVDRAGRTFARESWPDSATFWQGEQAGLLIADNQTDYYAEGDADRRQLLSGYAWGERADPL